MTVQQVLGLGSYRTAWAWLHKLRHAMVRPDRDQLEGTVEVDEAWVGGVEPGVFGRQSTTKAQVVIAVEERGRGMGRVRMKRITDGSAGSLESFVKSVVVPGSVIHSDGYWAIPTWAPPATTIVLSFCAGEGRRRPPSCSLASTWLSPSSSGGCSVPTKERPASTTWTITLTSSLSASTAGAPVTGAYCSSASWKTLCGSTHSLTTPSWGGPESHVCLTALASHGSSDPE
jgi:hypothetical protein